MGDPYYTQQSFDDIPRRRRKMGYAEKYPAPGLMRCGDCLQVLELEKFGRDAPNCLECTRAYQLARYHKNKHKRPWLDRYLRSAYGITAEEYNALFEAQGNVCAICGTDSTKGKNWCVDHNHVTGKVRAILCDGCNRGLGYFYESPTALRAAADYVEKHGK